MNLRKIIPFAVAPILFVPNSQAQEKRTSPNLIIILADDLGNADVGFNGCKDIPTPNIDRIAQNGVRFTNGYVSYCVCSPSRAGLLTGRYQDRFGYSRNPLFAPNDPQMGLPLSEETLADVLKKAGYKSLAIGKWHLGAHESLHPLKRGFNDFYGFLGGGHHYFPENFTLNDSYEAKSEYDSYKIKLLRNIGRVDEKEYLTDALSREAVSYIEKNKDNPFFIYLAYNAPHSPLQATEKYLSRFSHMKEGKRKTYAAMVSAVDDGVGLVLSKLKELDIMDNTMVVFLSDNGGPENDNGSDNGILRGQKSDLFEGGIRVPFAMQWPAKIKAGTVYDHPVISLDIFATIVAQTKTPVKTKNEIDGVNLIPFLTKENTKAPHDYLFWRKFDQKNYAVRKANEKMILKSGTEEMLFDLDQDVSEQKNLSAEGKGNSKKLTKDLRKWESELQDPTFLGLTQDKEYNEIHPDRFKRPTKYYFNPESKSAWSDGSFGNPFQDLNKLSSLKLNPGDSILLASGTTFRGSVALMNVQGTADQSIVISSYKLGNQSAGKLATIDAKGFPNGILIENCSHIDVTNLIITANSGGMKTVDGKTPDMRCGVLVQTTKPGNYGKIRLIGLQVKDIFYEEPGFIRGASEVNSANGTQRYGWGIRFINNTDGALLQDIQVMNCEIDNTSHTGLKFTAKGHGIENITVLNNRVTETGGPGVQMSGVKNGLVKGNYINGSGSNNDTRKWGRGSGLWTWGTTNVVIENNSFLNANGPGDSAGCHIDFNCSDVVVQYNLSVNNAGGFCEILGNNYNCAYRYNISVNDGYRVKGQNGAFQEGKIYWLSGYVGNKQQPKGPFNSYFYNNTIYTKKEIVANMAVANSASGILIANNIFYIEGESQLVPGDQYVPDKIGNTAIKNVVFENNLYLKNSNWPKEVLIQDKSPIAGNPGFRNMGGLNIEDYIPANSQLIKNRGIEILPLPGNAIGLKVGLKAETDILGNKILGKPDLGAIEILEGR